MLIKVQVVEKLSKTDHRDIQIQTEEFNVEPIWIEMNSLRFSNNQF